MAPLDGAPQTNILRIAPMTAKNTKDDRPRLASKAGKVWLQSVEVERYGRLCVVALVFGKIRQEVLLQVRPRPGWQGHDAAV